MMLSFFFSSRRRHTRWPRDWSSDVCSSDLNIGIFNEAYTTHKRVKQIANHKYRVSSTNILNEYAEDNGSVRHEMAVELGVLDTLSNNKASIFDSVSNTPSSTAISYLTLPLRS